jgi:serine/threonine protein kinase
VSWTVGLTLAGRYRLDAALGASSSPRVWAATHLPTGRRVAIRRLPPPEDLPQRAAMQLLGEVRAAASVQHPNVTELYEVLEGVDDGPLLVSELLRGETLEQKLSLHPMLSIRETASLMLPVVSAVGTAHARGIVHGDLAPSSVYLWTGNGAVPPVKVLDFGVARWTAGVRVAPVSVRAGAVPVRPSSDYAPPEQALPERSIDHRADIWALGCLLYECLSGLRPREFVPREAEAPALVVPIEQRAPGVPRGLADIIAHLLVSDPDHRAQNLIELFNALSPLADRPSPAFGWPGSERRVSGLTQRASIYPDWAASSPAAASPSTVSPVIQSALDPEPPWGISWRALALGASAVAATELLALAWLLVRAPDKEARAAPAVSASSAQEQRLSLRGTSAPPRQVLFDDFEDGNGAPLVPGFDNWQAFTVNPAGRSLELKLGPGHQSRGSVEMSWLLDHVETNLGPAGAGLRSAVREGVVDLSRYASTSFAHRYAPMVTPGLECRGASAFVLFATCRSLGQERAPIFELSIPVSLEWSTTTIDLYDLREVGGPLAHATNLKACLSAIDSFGFRADATDAAETGSCDSGTLWLDDISFR